MPVIVGIPCSQLPFKSDVPCSCEAEAVAFAAGVAIGLKPNIRKPRVFMQNSGLGNCVDVILSLLKTYHIEVEIVVSNREKPEHHFEMGRITEMLLGVIDYGTLYCYRKNYVPRYKRSGNHVRRAD